MTELNLVGRTIGRFEILEELGRGGMAVVYKARQKSPNRVVALKILPPEMTFNKDYIARFHQEADSVAALEHPHIVPIYAVDEDQGLHYIAMKFIQGRTLKELAQQEGAFSVERAVQLVGQVADALDYAHSQGVIHRDIKPSNMMVTDSGWVYLTDFGLARGTAANAGLTATGTVMGTPEYMSPEQAQGSPTIGPATDIYALGVVLYELLTGQFPFQADTPMGMLAARLIHPPRPPREYRGDLPFAVEDVIMRALARKAEARYKTAGELIADLRKAVGTPDRQPQRPATPSDGLTIPAVGPTPTPAHQQMAFRQAAPPQPQQQPTPWTQQAPAQPQQTPSWPQQAPGQPQQTPSWPQQPPAVPAPQRKGGFGSGLLIGIGVTVLLLVVGCIGLGVWASTLPTPNSNPTPQVGRRETPGTQPTPQARATPQAPTSGPALDPALAKQIEQGDAALLQADFSQAEAAYQQVLDKQGDSAVALGRMALLKDLGARYREAVERSQQAIDAAGDDAEQGAIAHALLADGLLYTSKFNESVEAGTKAVELDSSLGLAHAVYANAVARLAAERYEKDQAADVRPLIESARNELQDDPEIFQALAYSLIGDTYMSLHDLSGDGADLKSAKDAYSEALKLSEQPLFHAGLGFANNRGGDYTAARGSFNTALKLDSTFAQAQTGLGWSDFNDPNVQGFDGALAAFDKALELTPDDPWALYARGRALFAKEQYADATEAFRRAATEQADSLILAWLGRSLQRQGFNTDNQDEAKQLYEESSQVFLRSLALNDRQVVAWTYLGWTRQYEEKYQDSVDAFRKALEIDDVEEEIHNGLGWSLYNLEQYAEAEPEFRRAVELDTTYANAFYGLGQTLEKLGKIDDAKQAYRDAIKADPEYKDPQDALDKLPK